LAPTAWTEEPRALRALLTPAAVLRIDGIRSAVAQRGLDALEVAGQLPVRHGVVVEDDLLLTRRVQQMLEHEVAEGGAGDRALLEPADGFVERRRDAGDVRRRVRVAVEHLGRLDLVLDAVQAAGDRRGEGEIRIGVGAGDAALDAEPGVFSDDAVPARPVVV